MTDPTAQAWMPCPAGELTRLSAWLRFRRRLWTAATIGGVAAAIAGSVGVAWIVRDSLTNPSAAPDHHPRTRSSAPGSESRTLPKDINRMKSNQKTDANKK
jgi:hypothetical protein